MLSALGDLTQTLYQRSDTRLLTLTFSEDPGAQDILSNETGGLKITGGSINAFTGTGLTRTATFTPADSYFGNATVVLNSYQDPAGNAGIVSNKLTVPVDTMPPMYITREGSTALKIGSQSPEITFRFGKKPDVGTFTRTTSSSRRHARTADGDGRQRHEGDFHADAQHARWQRQYLGARRYLDIRRQGPKRRGDRADPDRHFGTHHQRDVQPP